MVKFDFSMNAHTISLILVSILISCLHSNSSYSDVQVEVQIKSIKEAMYKPINDGEEKRRQDVFVEDITSEIFYDKEGNVMKSIYYNTPTDIRSINKIKRNKKGKIIEMNQYDAQNKLTNKSKFSYDKKGNLSNQKSYKEGKKLNNTFTFQYDENGNAIQEINENKASGNKWITNMTYNKMNQLVEEIKTFPTGTSDKRTFEYDEKGNEVKSILIKSNGKETTFIS